MVIPGPIFPRLGSLLVTMANLSPLGSHAKSVTVSEMQNVVIGFGVFRSLNQLGRLTLEFNYFNWGILFADKEDFKIAEH